MHTDPYFPLGSGVIRWKIGFRPTGAIQAFGENSSDRSLTRAARPDKKISMSDAVLLDRVRQRLSHMLLTDDIGETLRAILPCDNLIRGHGTKESTVPRTINLLPITGNPVFSRKRPANVEHLLKPRNLPD